MGEDETGYGSRWCVVRSIAELREGDIVSHRMSKTGYVVMANYGSHAVVARVLDVSNPDEWLVLTKR